MSGSIVLDNTTIFGAKSDGFAYVRAGNGSTPTLTDTVGPISILNSDFSGNATTVSPAGGRGDILLFGYNRNLTISDATIGNPGVAAQKAIQIRGLQDGGDVAGVGPYDAGGNIALSNLTITGTYLQDLLAFYNIASFASFTTTGVASRRRRRGGLSNFDGVGGTLDRRRAASLHEFCLPVLRLPWSRVSRPTMRDWHGRGSPGCSAARARTRSMRVVVTTRSRVLSELTRLMAVPIRTLIVLTAICGPERCGERSDCER